ncbi:glycosyltransferase [Novosphingobium sp. 1949]|uniref:Chitooligosaccharide deacetylase n=1 Tax=Novosphingobium organovorum TaxID=2930092 RepID=A0ABT0BHT3_9SPHN|nr:glycosyltransferase [Novosphingobium organovorum]MCJ2184626.1 glycosyltransferase [Novosphingobium organovorum]
MSRPVFFDPTGRRSRWSKRLLGALLLIAVLAAVAFATTLVVLPRERELDMPVPVLRAATFRQTGIRRDLRAWLPAPLHRHAQPALTIGFYDPNNDDSFYSLLHHGGDLDWVVPATIGVAGPDHAVTVARDVRFTNLVANGRHHFKVLPMVQNYAGDHWDGAGVQRLLQDRRARRAFTARLAQEVIASHAAGLVMDFEALPPRAMGPYLTFLSELRAALPKGALIAVTAPAEDPHWPFEALSRACDKVIFMAYDQHWQGGEPGPIAAQDWFVREVQTAARRIPASKLVVALGSYAYDWHGSQTDALSLDEAFLAANDSEAPIAFDPGSGNAGFAYDEAGTHHTIWMLDAASTWNELAALDRLNLSSVALWKLGSEDPGVWSDFAAWRTGHRPNLARLTATGSADVEGEGEILRITDTPQDGARTVRFSPAGVIESEHYSALPTPYVVQRAGGSDPRRIALTFDDGPDPDWTPRILSILEGAHVPGTFFVIGENALAEPGLLEREVADGDEIGNHTYTHPNMANTAANQAKLELNTTQRLVEAYTGRRMTLFRAPYFGDAEPTTADELGPALEAQKAGYTIVGLHVDPNDWQRPGTQAIVQTVLDEIENAPAGTARNVVLLHDGGGNRAQTIAALPQIITALKARGYHFVTASQLIGVPQAQAMPRISRADQTAVRLDVGVFLVLGGLLALLTWLFYLAISLGIVRAVTMTALAWFQSRRQRGEPPALEPSVSVIIPAYNEERVILASVERILASDYPALEVIVADDGSRDATSALVAARYGHDPRVRLLTLTNGGKAAALNRALVDASGAIIIALDADTQFEPETVRRLARWFADPQIGAVAGDARVGNRVNLITRWQAVEYITAQNLERRALAGFEAMTVVPGAVGAWRRSALASVGGYPEDTLAEDQDLTIAIQRQGWRVTYDPRAVAWTEAPESFRALARQRFRWAFGTLQCLWKHRAVIARRQPTGLGLIGLPQAWLFQIAFAAISPLIDAALVISIVATIARTLAHGWAQTRGDVSTMALFWAVFTLIDVACGWIGYRLDTHRVRYNPLLLISQRLVYRQIMYGVVLRAIASAIAGWVVGWGKLERTGRVSAAGTVSAPRVPARAGLTEGG